jgi:hypothetical protein
VGSGTSTAAADPRAEFERRLSSLADLEMTVGQREKAVRALEEKFSGFESLGAVLPEGVTAATLATALGSLKAGDEKAFLRSLWGEKWTSQKLIDWADAFDAEELSPEERVRRTLAEERKKEEDAKAAAEQKRKDDEEAARKKANEDAITSAGAQLKEQVGSGAKWLQENVVQYPLIRALDSHPRIDHERMFTDRLIEWAEKNGDLPKEAEALAAMRKEIFDSIETEHRQLLDLANPKPRNMREEMSEFDRIEVARARKEEVAAASPPPRPAGPRSGADEARERLRLLDEEDAQRARLSYGR